MNQKDIVDQISVIRARNNINWMDILRIALEHAPNATKDVLRHITANDRENSALTMKLSR